MKRILSLCVLLGLLTTTIAQQTETQEEKLKALESKDTLLTQKQDTLKQLRTKTDSTNFRIGKQSITIIDDDDNTTYLQLLPPVPMCEPDRDEKPKKSLSFGNVMIKTLDEAEFEHQESEEKQNKSTHEFINDVEQENVTQII